MNTLRTDSEPRRLSRRNVLKWGAVAAGSLVTVGAIDSATSLPFNPELDIYTSNGTGDTLTVAAPGFWAYDIRKQAEPFRSVWDGHGDTVMVQSKGKTYDEAYMAETLADQVAMRMRTAKYGRAVMNGISMGGNVTASALMMLQANRTFEDMSVEPHAIMLDTPASADSIAGPFDTFRPLSEWAAEYGAGALANLVPEQNGMEPSLIASQLEALSDRNAPQDNSLDFLASMTYWESLKGGNLVHADIAKAAWKAAAGSAPFFYEQVNIGHAEFEANPEVVREHMNDIYTRIAAA